MISIVRTLLEDDAYASTIEGLSQKPEAKNLVDFDEKESYPDTDKLQGIKATSGDASQKEESDIIDGLAQKPGSGDVPDGEESVKGSYQDTEKLKGPATGDEAKDLDYKLVTGPEDVKSEGSEISFAQAIRNYAFGDMSGAEKN